jgi:UDPglucose 6-dehydrogenase
MRLSVIGLGKLGACAAACFAAKGFDVVGIDTNPATVAALDAGLAPVDEPRLQDLIVAGSYRLRASQDYRAAIQDSDVTFLIVPTPSTEDWQFSSRYLEDALRNLAVALKDSGKSYHLFAVCSTVSPGTTDRRLIPLVESVSGRRLNDGFGMCYSPEFVALGSVISDFLKPDLVVIGQSSDSAGEPLAKIYERVCENRPYVAKMSIVSAEITKISINAYVTMKISFANTLAAICEAIPGADIDAITAALGADHRIAPSYLKAGLSYGGPCFPRDNRAFVAFAREHQQEAALAIATDLVNKTRINDAVRKILSYAQIGNDRSIAVLGLAYKANSSVIEESVSVKIIEELLREEFQIIVYDPLALDNVRGRFGGDILYASCVGECFSQSSLCVIATSDDHFRMIGADDIVKNPTTIIDFWRILDQARLGDKVKYVALGKNAE